MGTPDRVTARLADGRPAVAELSTLVRASALRGYADPDLTLHPGQPDDWYGTEDGLDLDVLDADAATLRSLAGVAAEALITTRELQTVLAGAYAGAGASAVDGFLSRNAGAAATVADRLETAARCYPVLAEKLWRAVDEKVAAACEVAARWSGRRTDWLAACSAVLSGSSDQQPVATVEQSVKPFVVEVVRGDWLTAMRIGLAAAEQAYREALGTVAGGSPVRFEIPADLVPVAAPASTVPVSAVPASTVPQGIPNPSQSPGVSESSELPGSSAPLESSALPGAGLPVSSIPDLGAGSGSGSGSGPGSGSGLGVPDFGSLENPFGDNFTGDDPLGNDPPFGEDAGDEDEGSKGKPDEGKPEPESTEPESTEPENPEPESTEPENPEPENPESPQAPDPVVPGVPPEPARTPCEIAADELPQVGA